MVHPETEGRIIAFFEGAGKVMLPGDTSLLDIVRVGKYHNYDIASIKIILEEPDARKTDTTAT